MRTKLGPLLPALMLLSLTVALAAYGQSPASAPTDTAPPPEPVVETIPTGEIAVRSERAKRELGAAQKTLESEELLAEASDAVVALTKRFDELHRRSTRMLAGETSTSALDQAQLDTSILGTDLDALQAKLGTVGDEVDETRANVATERKLWQDTFDAASTAETSKAVLAQIDVVLDAARKADETGKKLQGRVVELQTSVAKMSEQLAADTEALESASKELVGDVFQRDRLPFWHEKHEGPGTPREIWQRLGDAWEKDVQISSTYLARRSERLFVQLVAFAALVAILLVVRRRRSQEELLEVSDAGLVILRHPIAIAALLVLLGSAWTLLEIPRPLLQLRGIILIVPSVILLRHFLNVEARPLLYAVSLLWIVDRLRLLTDPLPELPRVSLFVELALLLVMAGAALYRNRVVESLPPARRAGWGGAVVGITRFLVAGSVVGLLAEAAGYHALSTVVARTLALCPIAAFTLWGAVRAIEGLADLALTSRPLRFFGMVSHHRAMIRTRVTRVVGFLAVVWWLSFVLTALQISGPVWAALVAVLTTDGQVGQVSISLSDVLLFFLTIWLSFRLSRFIRFVLDEDFYPRVDLKKGQPYAFSTLTHYTIVTVGVLVAVLASGLDFDRLSIMVGALSVGIGFGLQTAVNNFVSGLILLTERPVEVGDTIALGTVFGEVERIGLRSTMVRTWQGAEVVVPNANLISEQVTNWTHSDQRRRLEIPVHVAYGTDPQRVKDLLLGVARNEERLLEDPGPFVLLMEMGDNSLDFELRAWTEEFDSYLTVKSALTTAVVEALAASDIEVPFPQRVVRVLPESP